MATSAKPPALLTTGQLLRLSAFWLGFQFFWTSLTTRILPKTVEAFAGAQYGVEHVGWYAGMITAAGALVTIIIQLTIGFISDHAYSGLGRRRPFLIYGTVTSCVAIVLFLCARTYWWLFAAYLFIEATINVASVPFQALLPDLVPEKQHSRAGAMMGLLALIGQLLSVISVGAVAIIFGRDLLYGFRVGLLPLFLFFLISTMLLNIFGVDELGWAQYAREKLEGAYREIKVFPGTVVRFAKTTGSLFSSMVAEYKKIELRTQPDLVYLASSRFVIHFGYTTFLQYVGWYIDYNLDGRAWLLSLGLSPDAAEKLSVLVFPAILISFILGGLLGNLASAPLSERFGKKFVIAAGMLLSGAMVIPLILTGKVWTALAAGTVVGAGWGAFLAADWAFACTLMPKSKAGSYMGLWDLTTLMPQFLAPVIAGVIRDGVVIANKPLLGEHLAWAAAIRWVFATIIVYFAAGIVILRWVREVRPSQQASPAR